MAQYLNNCGYWLQTNPQWIQTVHTQHPGVKVELLQKTLLVRLTFIHNTVTGDVYLQLLDNQILPRTMEEG